MKTNLKKLEEYANGIRQSKVGVIVPSDVLADALDEARRPSREQAGRILYEYRHASEIKSKMSLDDALDKLGWKGECR